MEQHWDAVVIGAGMAGLCAARAIAEAGKSVIVLEASDRVLQADPGRGGLVFEPDVVPWHAPLKRLGMGHACRIVLEFRGALAANGVPSGAFIHHPTALFETFWCQVGQGTTLWTAWAGGPKAHELSKENADRRTGLAGAERQVERSQ